MPTSFKRSGLELGFLPDFSVSEWRRQTNRRSTIRFHRNVQLTVNEEVPAVGKPPSRKIPHGQCLIDWGVWPNT